MTKIGFPKTKREEEFRIAILPGDIPKIGHPERLLIEEGYGRGLGLPDGEYRRNGAKIVDGKTAYLSDVVCQPKFCKGDFPHLSGQQTIFGWVHLEPWWDLTYQLSELGDTAIGWELMFDENGQHVFGRNNYITGEVGVRHAIRHAAKEQGTIFCKRGKGRTPDISGLKIAVIGNGYVGKGVLASLEKMSADRVEIFNSQNVSQLRKRLDGYDVVVNAASLKRDGKGRWNYALRMEDLAGMKPGALLVDLGINIRRSKLKPRSIYNPIQRFNNGANLAYVIDHVPTLDPLRASITISEDVCPYLDMLSNGHMDPTLRNAVIINRGKINYRRLGY